MTGGGTSLGGTSTPEPDPLLTPAGFRSGHFRLESGHHTDIWLDLDRLFLHPGEVRPLAAALAEKLARHRPEVICGPLTGGAFLAQMIALELAASFCFSERIVSSRPGLYPVDYRIPLAFHGDLRGRRVAVVDDAISAGSAVRGTLSALEGADANLIAIAALIAIGPHARVLADERAVPLETLRQLPGAVWIPDECPRCAAGEPLAVP